MKNNTLPSTASVAKAVGIDLPNLSEMQRDILLAVHAGDTDSRLYAADNVVALCQFGLSSLSDNGFMRLSLKGHLAVNALKETAAIADEDRG